MKNDGTIAANDERNPLDVVQLSNAQYTTGFTQLRNLEQNNADAKRSNACLEKKSQKRRAQKSTDGDEDQPKGINAATYYHLT